MKRKDGKYLEKVVQLIERSIDPEATVTHDVQMPTLDSPSGATTQCDIVIRNGKPPRETITIVEVQDRGRKPTANDFRGWQNKLGEVGAARLICVSKQGFTKRQKEVASQSGNRICLMKLTQLNLDTIPLNFLEIRFEFNDFVLKEVERIAFTRDPMELDKWGNSQVKLNGTVDDRVFSWDKDNLISLQMFCRDFIFMEQQIKSNGKNRIKYLVDADTPLYMWKDNQFLRIGIDFEFHWTNNIIKIPVSIMSYEQNDYGTLAWFIESEYKTSTAFMGFKIPLTKVDEGNYRIDMDNVDINLSGATMILSIENPKKINQYGQETYIFKF